MKNVILTSGPRGAGKSTYVKNFVEKNKNIKYLSRDELLIKMFGKTSLDHYTNGHEYAYEIFSKKIEKELENPSINLIVDSWNGWSRERKSLVNMFRHFGADNVLCWKFITPKNICLEWFMKKEDSKGYSIGGISRDYNLYHNESKNIKEDGFDKVYLINPLQLSFDFFKL